MTRRVPGALLALAFAISFSSAAAAQQKPTIAVMPTQYGAADAVSAANITVALADQFQGYGYQVVPMDRSRAVFSAMRLSGSQPYADSTAITFGRRAGADLVVYPRLLALGTPLAQQHAPEGDAQHPAAVLQLRVLNVQTGKPIYSRQVRREFEWALLEGGERILPPSAATATVTEATGNYFERVAGTRQEFRRGR